MALPVDDIEKCLVDARELLAECAEALHMKRKVCRCYSLMQTCSSCAKALETEHRVYAMLDGPLKFI